jgi:hypothetical protein
VHSLAAIPSCFGRGTHQHSLDLPSIGRGSRARSVLKVHKDALTSSPRLLLPNHHTLRQDPSLTLHISISGSMRIDMMANDNPLPMSLFMGFQECSGCSSISHQSGRVALLGPAYFRSSPCLQDLLSELRLSLLHTAEDQVSGRTVGQLVQASTNANHCNDVEVP